MKLEYTGVNTNKLHDELIAAGIVPQLVESDGDTTWITVDDDQVATVDAVVAAHDPTPRPQAPTIEERLAALEAVERERILGVL
jgi:hypothetical protein